MIITHNMASINTNRQLAINQENASKSLEKLSSGFRINKAGDDAAGLAISEKMRSQIRGLDQASRNSQDAISLIQTAEGSLAETQSILQRMKELATQSANDTNVNADRSEIQKEINQLSSEVNRIGNTTEFNTKKLLNGGGEKVTNTPTTLISGGQSGALGAFATTSVSVKEVKGSYKLTMVGTAGTHVAGDVFTISGQSFKVVTGVADASKGEVSLGGSAAMAASLGAAINANTTLHDRFKNVIVAGAIITLQENVGKAVGGTATATLSIAGTGLGRGTFASGKKEVAGKYTYNLDHAFELAGQTLTIGTAVLTAVSSNAGVDAFNIDTDKAKQALAIAAAINGDTHVTLGQRFAATVSGTTLILTEKATQATGLPLLATSATISAATAVKGKYDIGFSSLVASGGRITIDNNDIAVVTDANDIRLSNGTAMLAGSTIQQQTDNLISAVNKNAALNLKYTATANGNKTQLLQKAGLESLTAPAVSTNTSQKDGFEAALQIGANTAQSMTVTVTDMRSDALNITSNDANVTTVTAKNGTVATYSTVSNVTDGTTNDNVEYSLDVSTHEKATAAISVLDDAIQGVSAQRSQLGAFQNRLEHTISNLGTSSENLTAAESRVRDVDMAKEMMQFQKNNILQQAATAMMAQANQMPQGVLQLLR